ncbi:diguanylate cyclase [Acetobacterium wieringae]|uniref:Diguanylate cyclase n=1 Tax=Acetobacterium wieringae TaxID=52694 RepID=A0A5D0WHN4_9FIRM|nr:GGDEF domain-containing protein [Acetobacterium wieringae]TYC83710.1 diguanylate cyclase [Acetobacterium wieringae]
MLMIIITLGLFFVYFMKNREQKIGKIRLIVIASITATIGLLLSYFKPFGFIIDYMAICLPLTCLMVVIAIWKYDFLSAKARARSKAFESNRDAILLVSQQNIIIDYNKMASQLLGELGIFLTEGDLDLVFQSAPAFLETLKNGADSTLKWGMEPTERIYEISTRSIDSNHLSQGWIKTIRDVTEAYEWNKRLKRMAMVDELSGLNNRRAFMQKGERIIQEVNQKKDSLHLLMMDLDHFKNINDQFGHLNGDRVINHIGKALKTHYHAN